MSLRFVFSTSLAHSSSQFPHPQTDLFLESLGRGIRSSQARDGVGCSSGHNFLWTPKEKAENISARVMFIPPKVPTSLKLLASSNLVPGGPNPSKTCCPHKPLPTLCLRPLYSPPPWIWEQNQITIRTIIIWLASLLLLLLLINFSSSHYFHFKNPFNGTVSIIDKDFTLLWEMWQFPTPRYPFWLQKVLGWGRGSYDGEAGAAAFFSGLILTQNPLAIRKKKKKASEPPPQISHSQLGIDSYRILQKYRSLICRPRWQL